ncbi:hypothetical protein FLL45_12535 [Aliikangiella marina]|uniref:OmpR/PhoB-type domain-containing protein n=1 Tax=Aliikangiella marina TaxID=1712262 RepID=A0A545T8Z3_9GAMM|nr:winged helix-turn-helix domain-containing protein [Aliikangiella marina]TQV73693.1 hypothetical protein FLL45_12535 [Aliikangiella marina]
MQEDKQTQTIYIYRSLNSIKINQESIRLAPKEFELLLLMADSYPLPVSKESIIKAIWGEKINADELVTRLMADLRKKLGDSPRNPRFIETVIKQGYRVIAPIEFADLQPAKSTIAESPQTRTYLSGLRIYLAVAVLLIATVLLLIWFQSSPKQTEQVNIQQLKKSRLIGSLDAERRPRFVSGANVVVSENYSSEQYNISVTELDSRQTSSIISALSLEKQLLSPSIYQNKLAYVVWNESGQCEVRVRNLYNQKDRMLIGCRGGFPPNIDWIDDGKSIVLMTYANIDNQINSNIQIVDFLFGDVVDRVFLPDANHSLLFPRVGPANRLIAAVKRDYVLKNESLVLWDRETKSLRAVYESKDSIFQVVWQDAQTLMFSEFYANQQGIYRIDIESGVKELVYQGAVLDFDYDPLNKLIVTSENSWNHEIMRLDHNTRNESNYSKSTVTEIQPYIFPNGQWISYVSNKNGKFNIYKKNLETQEEVLLTDLNGEFIFEYQWFDNHSKLLVSLSAKGDVSAIEIDTQTKQVINSHQQPVYIEEREGVVTRYHLTNQSNGVNITDGSGNDFFIPDTQSLYRFQVKDGFLVFQRVAHGRITVINPKGEMRTIDDGLGLVHWYIVDKFLYYSFITTRDSEQTAKVNIARLDLDDFEGQQALIAEELQSLFLRGLSSFNINPQTQDIYFAGGNQSKSPAIYLLEPVNE